MEYLGYVNNPENAKVIDAKRDEARKNGWKVESSNKGWCVTEYVCKEGGWSYYEDASD
jgi:hypothetical protein